MYIYVYVSYRKKMALPRLRVSGFLKKYVTSRESEFLIHEFLKQHANCKLTFVYTFDGSFTTGRAQVALVSAVAWGKGDALAAAGRSESSWKQTQRKLHFAFRCSGPQQGESAERFLEGSIEIMLKTIVCAAVGNCRSQMIVFAADN